MMKWSSRIIASIRRISWTDERKLEDEALPETRTQE
jgi:hypothetical protein